jgi:branched-chain amino acid transport system permease protein
MTFQLFVEQLFNGFQLGMMLFLMAVGVTLVFGIMRVINLAHGAWFMLGGYFMAEATMHTQSIVLAALAAVAAITVVSIVIELIVLRPLYGRSHLDQVLATFGLTLMFNEAATMIWGREPLFLNVPDMLNGSVNILPGIPYPTYRLAITGFSIVIGGLLYLLINYTRVGALIRAGSDKREIVQALGVNIGLLYTLVFALGAILAAIAGLLTGPLLSVESGIGDPILIMTLVVVVIGGMGSIRGALAGALIVGIFDTMCRVLLPMLVGGDASAALVGMAVYILMAAVLLYSRSGLFSAARG